MPAELREKRTMQELEKALRQLLERKALDQIRVRELTELCAIRRQSFYYHFTDVYQLFDWSLERERTRLLQRQESCLTWQQALADLLDHTEKNRPYYRALLENRGQEGVEKVAGGALAQLLEKTLDYYRRRCGIPRDPAAEQAQLACWQTMVLVLLESWIRGDLRQQPKELILLMDRFVRQSAIGAAWQSLRLQ